MDTSNWKLEPPQHPPPAGTLEPSLSPQLAHEPTIYLSTPQLEPGPPKLSCHHHLVPWNCALAVPGDGITPTPELGLRLHLQGPTIQGRDMAPQHPGWDMALLVSRSGSFLILLLRLLPKRHRSQLHWGSLVIVENP